MLHTLQGHKFTKRVFIEYDGCSSHGGNDGLNRDLAKTMILLHKEENIVIRIRDPSYQSLREHLKDKNYFELKRKLYYNQNQQVMSMASEILSYCLENGYFITELCKET
jgi:hypothetical protein